ncbi:hypothetical protein [Haloarcula amylovorans]|uniref:hypothetical protein n=1 Tax=Haloarcula amylovorans TaxID=2562280 RepID=UPI0010760E38|nr:hypothetical protein [Halomicroarcula amylolytica]
MAATATGGELPTLDGRDTKALTEPMDCYQDDPATTEDQVAVYHRGDRYVIDPSVGVCDCPDMLHRRPDDGCKHLRRWWFRTGERQLPEWADLEAVDRDLREHIDDGGSA